MKTCRKISEIISKRIDRGLTFFEKFSLKFHKLMCPNCTKFEKEIDTISEALKKSNNIESTMSLEKKNELQEALKNY